MDYWYHTANIYHIYPLGLCNAPFSNTEITIRHKLNEIEKWIPHIKELGCNTICFGPVCKSVTHGYDTTDYFQIDNRLGSNEDFKSLIIKLKNNGFKVMLDGVFNHCGREFYAFKDILEKGRASVFCSWFSGLDFNAKSLLDDPFTYDTWNGYFELPKFNLLSVKVKSYLFDAVRFWIEYFDIDGLRIDAADCLDFDFIRDLRTTVTDVREDFWLMGEIVHGDYNRWANDKMLHSVTNYEAYKGLYSSHNDKNLFEIAYTLNREFNTESGIYKDLQLYNFADNHDQNRLASVVKEPAYQYTIYMLLYTMPGIPSLYYGSEWGIEGVKENGSDSPLRPYIDIDRAINKDLDLTRVISKLSHIRNENETLMKGSYKQLFIKYEQPFVFERRYGDDVIIVAINSFDKESVITIDGFDCNFYDVLNDEPIKKDQLGKLVVHPHWGRIMKAKH